MLQQQRSHTRNLSVAAGSQSVKCQLGCPAGFRRGGGVALILFWLVLRQRISYFFFFKTRSPEQTRFSFYLRS